MYHYVNRTKDKSVHGYLSLYHIKQQIAKAILGVCRPLEWTEASSHLQDRHRGERCVHQNHLSIQNLEMPSITEHCIMFIYQILQKIIVGHLEQVDLEALRSLISSIEWQCLDENHNRDSVHVPYNIFEFWIHIYLVNTMQAGGGWIPLPARIWGIKAVINPRNEDDYCFVYAVQLRLVDFSLKPNCCQITYLQRLIREQGVFINCSLQMPVEPTEKNFKKFEQENPFIHLNMYMPAADEEKCAITPIYVGMNRSTKIVNILYYRNEQTSHYAYIRALVTSSTTQQSYTTRSSCIHTVHALISIHRTPSLTISTRNTHISTTSSCVRSVSMSSTQQRQKNYTTQFVW